MAIGKKLLAEGCDVIFHYASDEETAEAVRRSLRRDGWDAPVIGQPLEGEAGVAAFAEQCRGLLNGAALDILVCNAACTDRTPWENLTWNQWTRVLNVNLNAPAELVRRLGPGLNRGGIIVFTGAMMGVYAHAMSVPYTVSKAGVHALTRALVKEYCERGIRVNAVLPGFVETPWQAEKPAEIRENICKKVSLHRFARPEEVAKVVWDVITSEYMNGALVEIDGGYCYR